MSTWRRAVNTAGLAATMMVLAANRKDTRRERNRELWRAAREGR